MPERISALIDGELMGTSLDAALEMLHQPAQFARYDVYHQIRNVLRSGEAGLAMRPGFAANLMQTLQES